MNLTPEFLVSLVQIIWIDLLLSGDNAVVIALACRNLPENRRKIGMILGAGAAVALRILFALVITYLLAVPWLKIVGGLLLFWIAIKLLAEDEDEGGHGDIAASDKLWKAVWTICIADAVMSLDNVIAIAGAARGHPELFIFGLLLSIPLVVAGSTLLMTLISRFPIIVWAGAALLGWIAGEMIFGDPIMLDLVQQHAPNLLHTVPIEKNPLGREVVNALHYGAAVVGAAIVLLAGWMIKKKSEPVRAHN